MALAPAKATSTGQAMNNPLGDSVQQTPANQHSNNHINHYNRCKAAHHTTSHPTYRSPIHLSLKHL